MYGKRRAPIPFVNPPPARTADAHRLPGAATPILAAGAHSRATSVSPLTRSSLGTARVFDLQDRWGAAAAVVAAG